MKKILSYKLFENNKNEDEQIKIIDTFIKEFNSSDSWYDTNDYWSRGDFNPPFKTNPEFLSKVVDKINDLNIKEYSNFNFKDITVTDDNINEIFNECVNFINWWNNDIKIKIEHDLNQAYNAGKIKTEQDATNITLKYLTNDIISYKPTGFYSDFLPKNKTKIFSEKEYKHPWFKDTVKNVIFEDDFGRIWNSTTGQIEDGVKLRKSKVFGYCIDKLGGMSWSSQDGINFKCEYRTEKDSSSGPETFVG